MGNNLSTEKRRTVYDKLTKLYDSLKSKKIGDRVIFEKLNEEFDKLVQINLPDLDLSGMNLDKVDGFINSKKFTLIGWENDEEDEIDVLELEEILSDSDN